MSLVLSGTSMLLRSSFFGSPLYDSPNLSAGRVEFPGAQMKGICLADVGLFLRSQGPRWTQACLRRRLGWPYMRGSAFQSKIPATSQKTEVINLTFPHYAEIRVYTKKPIYNPLYCLLIAPACHPKKSSRIKVIKELSID